MFKIAISGMKGRKKDTFLLSFVILLSVIFVVTSTSIYTSSEKTKLNEKMAKFGTWKNVYITNELSVKEEQILSENENSTIIKAFNDSTVGKMGSLPTDFLPYAHFQLIEGTLPNAIDEVAIEYNQISNFNTGVKIGDVIPIRVSTKINTSDEWTAFKKSINYYTKHHVDEIYAFAKMYPSHKVATFIDNYESYFFSNVLPHIVNPNDDVSLANFLNDYNIEKKEILLEDSLKQALILNFGKSQIYNTFASKTEDNMRIDVSNKVKYSFFSPYTIGEGNTDDNIRFNTALTEEEILERGIPMLKEVSIIIPLKVTGFIENYTENWDGGNYYPNAYVSQNTFEKLQSAFYNNSFIDVNNYQLETFVFQTKDKDYIDSNAFKNKTQIKNTAMYPEVEGESDLTVTVGTLSLIAVATVAAVFQINLTQMKRRTRKLVLLKSIGAVKNQIYRLIFSEIIVIFIICIPIGTLIGLGLSFGALHLMNTTFNLSLSFYLDLSLLLSGLILSIASVVIGMSFPVLKAVNVPLTGAFNEPVRVSHAPKKKVSPKSPSKISKLTFKHISLKHLKRERKKNILTYALYTVAIGAILCTIALSYVAYTPYIDNVILTNAPDFSAELIHGLSKKDTERVKMELKNINGVSDVILYKYGLNAYMYHQDLFNHAPFTQIPARRFYKEFSNIPEEKDYLIRKARLVNTYAFDTNESSYKSLVELGIENTLNRSAFEKGEEVILLLPSYSGSQFSYSFKDHNEFHQEYQIQVGDTFDLTIPTENKTEAAFTNDVEFHKLKVGAIVHSFDFEGIWPFSKNPDVPIIITSYNGLGNLYKGSFSTPRMTYNELVNLIQNFQPTKNGRVSLLIYTDKKANMMEVETEISKVLKPYFVKPNRNFIENEVYFNNSLKLSMIILILGFSITTIALMILYNTSLSKIEGERQRIGILQALGVTHKQFKYFYLACGILFGIFSLILGSLMAVLILTLSTGGVTKILSSNFTLWWLFPWKICLGIGLIYIFISTIIYYVPIKKALKSEPIHNISGLQN